MKKLHLLIASLLVCTQVHAAQLKDTIIDNDLTINTTGVIFFEGATSDDNEGILTTEDITVSDKTWTHQNATYTITGRDTTDTLTNKTIDGDDNTLQDIAISQTKLIAGPGLNLSTDTLSTDSTEADFLASGALTCGASTQGKAQVHTTPLQYCDNAGTPVLQYSAYAASDGDALAGDSATSFWDTGTCEVARGCSGAATFTANGALYGNTTSAFQVTAAHTTNGTLLIGDGSGVPTVATLTATANETEITNGAGSITVGIVTSPTLDGSNFTGIAAGAYDAASIDGDDINSNIAGSFLTLTSASPDTLDVDAELQTIRMDFSFTDPGTGDTGKIQGTSKVAFTGTKVYCSTNTGTATINLEERVKTTPDTAGTDMLTSDLVCDTDSQETTTFTNAGIAAEALVSLTIVSVASTPGVVRVHLHGTIDDI